VIDLNIRPGMHNIFQLPGQQLCNPTVTHWKTCSGPEEICSATIGYVASNCRL